MDNFDPKVFIRSLATSKNNFSFDVVGIDASLANSLRRIIISEVF